MTLEQIYQKSAHIQRSLLKLTQIKNADIIGCYYPIGSEVLTLEIIGTFIKDGKRIALPRVESDSNLKFYMLTSLQLGSLKRGKYGIMEPLTQEKSVNNRLDLIIVPGIAFDMQGNRLGYGKGYYDRFLADNNLISVALAYESQIYDTSLPVSHLDRKIDILVTEAQVIHFKK